MPPVDLSTKTITRLQKVAIPLVDTFDSVIAKLLDAYEASAAGPKAAAVAVEAVQAYDPSKPPNLSYTTVKHVKFCGTVFKPAETFWNTLMNATIRAVAKKGVKAADLMGLVLANCALGKKTDNGYKYLEDVGLSVQGQDANGAWRVIYHLASKFGLSLEVVFTWQNNPKAAAPNAMGSFTLHGS